MESFEFVLRVLAVFFLLAALGYVASLFNGLIQAKHNIGKAWHNIDVLLRQRNEELAKLADAAQAYGAYEGTTLSLLAALRARYAGAHGSGAQVRVENEMGAGLRRLAGAWENHPVLEAGATFRFVQDRLSSLEGAIADRRAFFNDTVTIYNTQIEVFPQSLLARLMGLERHPLLDIPGSGPAATDDATDGGGA